MFLQGAIADPFQMKNSIHCKKLFSNKLSHLLQETLFTAKEAGWLPALLTGLLSADLTLDVLPLCVFQCEQYVS